MDNIENPQSNPPSEFGDPPPPHHGLNSRNGDNSPASSITSHSTSSSDVSKSSQQHYQSDVLGGGHIPEDFYPPPHNVSSTGNSNNLEANTGGGGPYFSGPGSYGDFSNLVSQQQHHHSYHQPHTAASTPFDFMSLAASTQSQSYANHPSYWYYHSQNHFPYPWAAASMAASNPFINSQHHHPYFMSNQMMTSNADIDEESIKLEKDYYEANTESSPAALALNLNAGSNQVCLPDQLNALGYSRSDLAKVTLKKPRVTFTSQQVLQLEQEFKIQR